MSLKASPIEPVPGETARVARAGEEVRYRLALRELRRLDDRDLDDLALGRGDLLGLARATAGRA